MPPGPRVEPRPSGITTGASGPLVYSAASPQCCVLAGVAADTTGQFGEQLGAAAGIYDGRSPLTLSSKARRWFWAQPDLGRRCGFCVFRRYRHVKSCHVMPPVISFLSLSPLRLFPFLPLSAILISSPLPTSSPPRFLPLSTPPSFHRFLPLSSLRFPPR